MIPASPRMFAALAAAVLATAAPAPLALAQTAAPDPAASWTLQGENASLSTASLTDRYYVNGIRLGYTSPEGDVPAALTGVGRAMWGDGTLRISFDISQQIYTPNDTRDATPPSRDRPYAGVLLATGALIRDVPDSRSMLALSLGLVGPDAQAKPVQNGFHDLIGQSHTNGWHDQIHDEPLIEITSARTWRLPIVRLGPLETDALPDLAVGLGNLRIYGQTGVRFRIGQDLGADYGPARLQPGPTGGDAFHADQPFAWYVFAGADAQVVGRDVTLDGNDFRDSAHVASKPFVGEFEAGLALLAFGTRLTYTHVLQTQEFTHQKGGMHQFGSLALSMLF